MLLYRSVTNKYSGSVLTSTVDTNCPHTDYLNNQLSESFKFAVGNLIKLQFQKFMKY